MSGDDVVRTPMGPIDVKADLHRAVKITVDIAGRNVRDVMTSRIEAFAAGER
jgi:hypothetical protein